MLQCLRIFIIFAGSFGKAGADLKNLQGLCIKVVNSLVEKFREKGCVNSLLMGRALEAGALIEVVTI